MLISTSTCRKIGQSLHLLVVRPVGKSKYVVRISMVHKPLLNSGTVHAMWTLLLTGALPFGNAHFGSGTGPILLDDVGCSGSETNLTDCPRNSFISCYYGHSEDAGVRCQGTIAECCI